MSSTEVIQSTWMMLAGIAFLAGFVSLYALALGRAANRRKAAYARKQAVKRPQPRRSNARNDVPTVPTLSAT